MAGKEKSKGLMTLVAFIVAATMVLILYGMTRQTKPEPHDNLAEHPMSGTGPVVRGDGDFKDVNAESPGQPLDILRFAAKGKYTIFEFWSPY